MLGECAEYSAGIHYYDYTDYYACAVGPGLSTHARRQVSVIALPTVIMPHHTISLIDSETVP